MCLCVDFMRRYAPAASSGMAAAAADPEAITEHPALGVVVLLQLLALMQSLLM